MQESEGTPNQEGSEEGITSPPFEEDNQSTTPPGNPPVDEEALRRGQEGLEQAGGGH